jgi:hypothetical protein
MEETLSEAVAELVATRPTGYLMKELEQILNGHYHSLNSGLEQTLQHYPERAALQKEFTVACAGLRGRMVEQYDAAKERALRKIVARAGDVMAAFLQSMDVRRLWSDTPLEECDFKLDTVLDQLSEDTKESLLSGVDGWLLGPGKQGVEVRDAAVKAQIAREKRFRADLAAAIQERARAFKEECTEELGRLSAHRETQCASTFISEEDDDLASCSTTNEEESTSSPPEQERRGANGTAKLFAGAEASS